MAGSESNLGPPAPVRDAPGLRHTRGVNASVPPPELVALREQVDAAFTALLDELDGRLRDLHPRAVPMGDELRRFAAGGKRLRPTLLLLGHQVAARSPGRVLGPALALELVHTCALLHDDLIDDAADRRGQPAAHVAFSRRHDEAGWHGDGARYGMSAALLLGDLAHVWADELFDRADVDIEHAQQARAVFATMREEVTVGQFLDVTAAVTRTEGTSGALEVANLKSARYSVARPLEIGAVLATGRSALADGLFRFGVPLGQAFQLRDDILGVFGDEATTGKSAVSDLVEGKRTWLLAATLERLPAEDAEDVGSLLGDPSLDDAAVSTIRRAMVESGGLAATEEKIDDLVDLAMTELERLPVGEGARSTLRSLASYLVDRER